MANQAHTPEDQVNHPAIPIVHRQVEGMEDRHRQMGTGAQRTVVHHPQEACDNLSHAIHRGKEIQLRRNKLRIMLG